MSNSRGPGGKFQKKEQPAMAQGFGESRTFNAPEGTFPPEPGAKNVLECHIGGIPVKDLPLEAQARVLYAQTDEAQEEHRQNREHEPSGIEYGRSPEEKAVTDRFGDSLKAGMQPWEAHDPMRELADRHCAPGEKPRFLSENKIRVDGTRGWQPKMVDVGGTMQPVKLGNMVLATMPVDLAEKRKRHYEEQAQRMMVQSVERLEEERRQIMSDSKLERTARRRGQAGDDGFESFRGDEREMEDHDFSVATY